MRRRFKLLAVLIGVPALLALIAAIVLPILVDSAHYKRQAIALVKAHTGHEMRIDGNVRLRVLPRLRVTVTDVRFANPPGFSTPDLARLAWLAVDFAPLALLAGRIEPRAVVASGLTVNLERDRHGRGNWETPTRVDHDSAAVRRGVADSPLAAVAIGALELRDAVLHWRDQTSNEMITVPSINLQTDALDADNGIDDVRLQVTLPGGEARLEARGDARFDAAGRGLVMPEIRAVFRDLGIAETRLDGTLSTRLTADLAEQRLNLESLRVVARTAANDERAIAVEITAGLGFDLAGQRLEQSSVSVVVPGYALSGISGDLQLTGLLSGNLQAGTFTFEDLKGSGTMAGEKLADSSVAFTVGGIVNADLERQKFSAPGMELAGNVDGDRLPFRLIADFEMSPRSRTLDATGMHLSIRDWRIDGATSLRAATSPPEVQGVLDLRIQDQPLAGSFTITTAGAHEEGVDLRFDVVADLDIEDADYVVRSRSAIVMRASVVPANDVGSWRVNDLQLGARLTDTPFPHGDLIITLQADLEVNTNDGIARSDNLRVALDDSQIVGSVSVRRFDKPAVQIDLQADTIDADRYLLPESTRTGRSARAMPVGASIDALRALDLTGEVRVRKLTLKGVQMEDVRLTSSGTTAIDDGTR